MSGMKRKDLQKIGRYQVGQIVRFHRPDPASVLSKDKFEEWKYLENKGAISSIRLCESGALITINDNGQEIIAHVHLGIMDRKQTASAFPNTLAIIQDAPRQMEISA